MGIMVQYPGKEIPGDYRLYVIYVANRFGNVAEKVMCEQFETIADNLGSGNLIAKVLSWPGRKQAAKKFNIKPEDARPVLIVIDRHPDKWVASEHKMIKIELGKLKTKEEVLSFLDKFTEFLREGNMAILSWQVRLERLKQEVKPLPISIDLGSILHDLRDINDAELLPPKPPELLQKIKWVLLYGHKHWKIIIVAIAFVVVAWLAQSYLGKESMNSSLQEDNQQKLSPALRVTFLDGYIGYVELTVQYHLDKQKVLLVHSKYGGQAAAVNDLLSAVRGNAITELEKRSLANARVERKKIADAIMRACEADMERTGHIIDTINLGEIEVSQ